MASTTRGTIRSCMMSLALGLAIVTSVSAQERTNIFGMEKEGGPILLGTSFTYQGRLLDAGVLVDGTADLSFTLYDQPALGLQIGRVNSFLLEPINEGLFIVVLDFGPGSFGIIERWLQISVNGSPLSPRQLVHSAPVAQYALSADGATITNISAANIITGTLPDARLSGKYSNLLNFNNTGNTYAGTSLNIDSDGFVTNNGKVGINKAISIWNLDIDATNTAGLGLRVARNGGTRIAIRNNSGGIDSKSWGMDTDGGNLKFVGLADNDLTILSTPMTLMRSGDVLIQTELRLGTDLTMQGTSGGTATFYQSDGDLGVQIVGNTGEVRTYGFDGLLNTRLWNGSFGELNLWDGSVTNDLTVTLSASSNSGGRLTLKNATAIRTGLFAEGDDANGAGRVTVNHGSTSANTIMAGEDPDFGTGSEFSMLNDAGVKTWDIDSDQGDGGSTMTFYDPAGVAVITIDSEIGGDGRITTQELSITGGSDLSEQFDVRTGDLEPEPAPGMIVCIDTQNIGKLVVSSTAYDRTVAGIISGAGGIKTGMMMGQKGSIADGEYPVALTGRVYVMCVAANGSIEPGDLLTTSNVLGHAMKVTDYQAAQGAIIGKAMSRLDSTDGKGLVLVLVTLQ